MCAVFRGWATHAEDVKKFLGPSRRDIHDVYDILVRWKERKRISRARDHRGWEKKIWDRCPGVKKIREFEKIKSTETATEEEGKVTTEFAWMISSRPASSETHSFA